MTNLYLIAHKVRGEPAFDIACQMICPECDNDPGCSECYGLGYWWIIPTSGHRAYPYFWIEMTRFLYCTPRSPRPVQFDTEGYPVPTDWPDHYPHSAHNPPKVSLIDRLGLKPKPTNLPPIPRRI